MFDPSLPPNEPDPITTREMNSHIAYFLTQTRTWGTAEDRIAVARSDLPAQVRAEMDVWHHQMFGSTSPLAAEWDACYVLLASGEEGDDVVTYEVHWDDMKAQIYETRGQLGVFFPIDKTRAGDADYLYQKILNLSRLCLSGGFNWELRSRADNEGRVAFSTNPRQSIYHAPSWRYRLDAGLFDGRLYFLLYKRKGQLIGLEGGKWFDKDFRHHVSESMKRTK